MSTIKLSLPEDYVEFLRELVTADVEFLLIGGWAIAVHGHGRATDDMDVFVRASEDNAAKIMSALEAFGAPTSAVTAGLFSKERYGYRMGRKPLLIEVLTTIDGVSFDEALVDALSIDVAGIRVPVIGRTALIANKKAAGRFKDLADVEALEGG